MTGLARHNHWHNRDTDIVGINNHFLNFIIHVFTNPRSLSSWEVFDAIEKYEPEFSTDDHTNIPGHTLVFPYKVDLSLSRNGICVSSLNRVRRIDSTS